MNELAKNGDKRMTVKEVAEALGVDDSTITKRVKSIFPDIVRNGLTTYLTELQVVAVKQSLIENGHLGQLSEVKAATTDLEMMLLEEKVSPWKSQKIKELTEQLSLTKPKAELADRMLNTGNLRTITDFGKIIAKPRKIFTDLLASHILFRRESDQVLLPYQKYIDAGYFDVKYNLVKIGDHEERKPQTYITAKGEKWLADTIYAPRLPL